MGNNFQESFEQFGGLGLSPFQFSNQLQLLNINLCQDSIFSFFSFFFEKVNKGHSRGDIIILVLSQEGLELVSSLQH